MRTGLALTWVVFLTGCRPGALQAPRWKMAEELGARSPEPAAPEPEPAGGRDKSSKKTEDLLAMVKKLQKEGSLEPQIEDLINRISELQQGKKATEELGEARACREFLCGELDSLNGEKVHLEEVLSKKQEAVMILRQHCQERGSETQRLDVEEHLEDLMDQHKDLWEFHSVHLAVANGNLEKAFIQLLMGAPGSTPQREAVMLEQRLAQEIGALERSKEQLLAERTMLRARLQEVEQRLLSAQDIQGAPAEKQGMKVDIEKVGGQTGSTPDPGVCREEAGCQLHCAHEEDLEQQVELALTSP